MHKRRFLLHESFSLLPYLARMRAFNGDYTVFTTTTGEQGLAAIAVSKDGESYRINEKGERVSEN